MIKGVHIVRRRRPGRPTRWYIYAWRGGPRVMAHVGEKRPRLDPDALGRVHQALDERQTPAVDTLMSLARAWRSRNPDRASSPEWDRLSKNTKKTWGSALDLIEEKWGETPLVLWNDPRMRAKVVAWRDSRASTPRAADIGVTVLRTLLEFGCLRGLIRENAARNIPSLYRNGQRADIIWTDDDIARFTAAAQTANAMHVLDGLRLAALTGLRREDLVTLTWSHVGDMAIVKTALKRSAGKRQRVTMPRIPQLDQLLGELRERVRKPGVDTVLVNSFGAPWSADGFGGSFNRIRDRAGIMHRDEDTGALRSKHLHDVRGTFCTRLLTEADLTDQQVAGVMGWSVEKVAGIRRVYVDQTAIVCALGKRLSNLR